MFWLNFISYAYAQPVQQVPVGTTFTDLLVRIINWALYAAGGVAIVFLVYSGILYITAGGDQEKAGRAKNALTYAIIGIVVISLSLAIIDWLSYIIQHSAS